MEEEVTLPVATSGTVSDNNEDQVEELDAVLPIRYKQDDLLRQKDQEPTALKGVLKEEVANHDQALEPIRQQYQSDVQQLRKNMEKVSQDQLNLESERQKINHVVRNLQRKLEESREEINKWKEMFQKNKENLRKTKAEVFQLKLEKVEYEDELYEMKNRLSLVQSELIQEKQRLDEGLHQRDRELSALKGALKDEVSGRDQDLEQLREQFHQELCESKKEYDELMRELQQFQDQVKSLMQEKEWLEDSLYQRDWELSALKGALKDEVSGHDREAEKMHEKFNRELQQTKRDYEDLLKVKKKLEDDKADAEHMRQVIETTLQDTRDENDDLRRKISGLEAQVKELKMFCDDLQRAETCLKDRIGRVEAERKKMEESIGEGRYEANASSNNVSLDDLVDKKSTIKIESHSAVANISSYFIPVIMASKELNLTNCLYMRYLAKATARCPPASIDVDNASCVIYIAGRNFAPAQRNHRLAPAHYDLSYCGQSP
ncbi:cingulin-like [Phyllobates terribilis]|uniref:cingulin-like n=1 Tax=Phyllobates terribilis TaxID=111132 RepID=UPI003CCB35BA